jgi:hypothetical protein
MYAAVVFQALEMLMRIVTMGDSSCLVQRSCSDFSVIYNKKIVGPVSVWQETMDSTLWV